MEWEAGSPKYYFCIVSLIVQEKLTCFRVPKPLFPLLPVPRLEFFKVISLQFLVSVLNICIVSIVWACVLTCLHFCMFMCISLRCFAHLFAFVHVCFLHFSFTSLEYCSITLVTAM